jgi:hypothetical protein
LVYPNPSIDNFSILSNQSASIDLIDLSGKVLITNQVIKANVPTKIGTANFAAGIYLLRMITDNEKRVIRVLVENSAK